MGMFDSVANMFRPTQQVSMAPVQVAPGSNMPVANPGATAGAPQAGTSQPTAGTPPANPLDAFTPLWQNDPNAAPTADPFSTPLFNTDPAKIQEAAGKMDFLASVPQDVMAKAMGGNDPAAFMQVMNFVAQKTLATAAQLSTATVEQGASRSNQRMLSALPGRVKQIQLDAMQPENPALQHPAAQPFLQMARTQLQMKNPGMSAQEIQKRAEQYVSDFSSAMMQPAQDASSQGAGGDDWDRFLQP